MSKMTVYECDGCKVVSADQGCTGNWGVVCIRWVDDPTNSKCDYLCPKCLGEVRKFLNSLDKS